jgi:hypothetical protein
MYMVKPIHFPLSTDSINSAQSTVLCTEHTLATHLEYIFSTISFVYVILSALCRMHPPAPLIIY